MKLYFKDNADGYYEFEDTANPKSYAGLIPTSKQIAPAPTAAELTAQNNAQVQADLIALDMASIRSIREWLVLQPTAPQLLKDKDLAAATTRAKLK